MFAAGLRWALRNDMRVINLSLSTGKRDYYSVFHRIADEAAFRRVMLVCAINNMPGPSFPAEYSSVFSVASHGDVDDPLAFDYNPTPPAEWGAPGIDVEVPWLDGKTIVATGNSFAAPAHRGRAHADPRQAPRAHAVPGQDGADGARAERAAGARDDDGGDRR